MSRSVFDPGYSELPATLPIFPLAGALLLPKGRLPLNIFEPRYLAMTRDALKGERLIGMVQPQESGGDADAPAVYRTGCAGRLVSFSETDDGRYLIALSGLTRFHIAEELPRDRPYRRITADWQPFRGDFDQAPAGLIDRPRLLAALKPFFERFGIAGDWKSLEGTHDERLVAVLAMACPFRPSEKQALLEAVDLAERARLLTALVEMAVLGGEQPDDAPRH
jgi:Lon protease-like protein